MSLQIKIRPFVILSLFFAFFFIMTGCDKYARYRALNLFFDGVPHPDEPLKKEDSGQAIVAKADLGTKTEFARQLIEFRHPPAEGKDDCSFCHGPMTRIVIPPKNMCLRCHEHLKENRPFLHGPAVVDCVFCHNVHRSQTRTLLRKVDNSLCFDCHDQQSVLDSEPHRKLKNEQRLCLSCHDPHGGKDRFFLK